MQIKKRLFEIIQAANPNDKASRIFDISLMTLIVFNVFLVIADTFVLPDTIKKISSTIETVSVIIFSIEYVLRIWTADLLFPDKKVWKARLKYIFSFFIIFRKYRHLLQNSRKEKFILEHQNTKEKGEE